MDKVKRISLMIGEEQHEELTRRGLNVSGLVRDLIGDHLSEQKVILAVSEETALLYDQIVSNTGAKDEDIEPYFVQSLKTLLKERIRNMEKLHKSLERKGGKR